MSAQEPEDFAVRRVQICWFCALCDPNHSTPHCLMVQGDPTLSVCLHAVWEHHKRIAPKCSANTEAAISIDFLIRRVQ